jgi:proteasomal ATPase-associated factor 1
MAIQAGSSGVPSKTAPSKHLTSPPSSPLSLSIPSPTSTSHPLSAITHSPTSSLLAAAISTGLVHIYNTRSLSAPLISFTRNSASIEDITFSGQDLVVGTEDGLPFLKGLDGEGGVKVKAEIIGGDCEGVCAVRVHWEGGDIWTAGDDGVIRMY